MKVHVYVRARSSRLERKNFRLLGGEPLWRRTLRRYAGHEVFVDTDSPELIRAVEGDPELAHVHAYPRLEAHSGEEPGLAMTHRFLNEFVSDPREPVAIVHVTSPFLDPRRVENAWAKVRSGEYDSAASVTEVRDYCYRRGQDGALIPLNHDGRRIPGTQHLDPVLHLNHAFFILSRASLNRWGHRVGDRPLTVPLPFPESIDIDWPADLQLAEAVIAAGIAQ